MNTEQNEDVAHEDVGVSFIITVLVLFHKYNAFLEGYAVNSAKF